ncbi:MAG: class III signal peptide-containing protein [Candidatus Omnitrophica bacterium]|nr:class III signal peptide-containing protein [Candidatus Omnitrophota bacterium]
MSKSGQITLEYILLLTALVVAIILFMSEKGPLTQHMKDTYRDGFDQLEGAGKRTFDALTPGPGSP